MEDNEKYLEKKQALIRSGKRKGYISVKKVISLCVTFKLSNDETQELKKELAINNIKVVNEKVAWIKDEKDEAKRINKCYFAFITKVLNQEFSPHDYDEDKVISVKPTIDNYFNNYFGQKERMYVDLTFGLKDGNLLDEDEVLAKIGSGIKDYVTFAFGAIKKLKSAEFIDAIKTAMGASSFDTYKTKEVTSGSKDCLLFSPYKGDKPVSGPVIMQTKTDDFCTDIGYVTKYGQFDYSFSIYKEDGSEAAIIFYNGEKEPRPEIYFGKDYISFGVYYPKIGYHGNLYTLKKDGHINIHYYQSGNEVAKYCTHFKMEEFPSLTFPFPKLTDKEVTMKDDSEGKIFYTKGDESESAAIKFFKNGKVVIGRSDNSYINGLSVEFINSNEIDIRKSFDGSKNSSFHITSHKKTGFISFSYLGDEKSYKYEFNPANGFSTLRKIVYDEEDNEITNEIISNPEWEAEIVRSTRSRYGKSNEEKLGELIGLSTVKRMISRLKAFLVKNKDSKIKPNLNMFFTGNAGTGKTEVARLLAGILYDNGIVKEDRFIEVDRSGLIGEYIGQSENITKKIIEKSLGGVLFVDEAYSLYSGEEDKKDYGSKVLDLLVKAMEDHKGEICIIFAGYKKPMENLYKMNQGLASRINRKLDFPNYSIDELKLIARKFLKDNDYTISEEALDEVMEIMKVKSNDKDFANAREVRNVLEYVYEIQAERTLNDLKDREIVLKDVQMYEEENHIIKPKKDENQRLKIDFDAVRKLSETKKKFTFDRQFVLESSVNIKIYDEEGKEVVSEGSGFFITPKGLIATCAHVIKDAKNIKVIVNIPTSKGKNITQSYSASIVGVDTQTDVGLLQIDKPGEYDFTYYQIEDGENIPNELDEIVMGGYPLGGERFAKLSLNEGKVQSYNKDNALGEEAKLDKIYVDLTGSAGNSGSGVISKETGRCIGIYAGASLGYSSVVQFQLNYAIPTKYLWDLMKKCSK